jgi:hypothetical protein
MTDDNRFDSIARRSRTSLLRDLAFALLVASVATFSLGSLRAAAANLDHASAPAGLSSSR